MKNKIPQPKVVEINGKTYKYARVDVKGKYKSVIYDFWQDEDKNEIPIIRCDEPGYCSIFYKNSFSGIIISFKTCLRHVFEDMSFGAKENEVNRYASQLNYFVTKLRDRQYKEYGNLVQEHLLETVLEAIDDTCQDLFDANVDYDPINVISRLLNSSKIKEYEILNIALNIKLDELREEEEYENY